MSYPSCRVNCMQTIPVSLPIFSEEVPCKPENRIPLLTWGLKDGELISIHDQFLETGLACKCTCPECGSRLVAKHGTGKKVEHFAHEAENQGACSHAQESALHLLAKRILQEHQTIHLPESRHHLTREIIDPSGYLPYRNVRTEVSEGSLRPDVIVETAWGDLRIEVFVSNRVQGKRIRKIRAVQHATIEIDLSSCQEGDLEAVTQAIIHSPSTKAWLYNRPFSPSEQKAPLEFEDPVNGEPYESIPELVECRFCGEVKPWSTYKSGKGTCKSCLPREVEENFSCWKRIRKQGRREAHSHDHLPLYRICQTPF